MQTEVKTHSSKICRNCGLTGAGEANSRRGRAKRQGADALRAWALSSRRRTEATRLDRAGKGAYRMGRPAGVPRSPIGPNAPRRGAIQARAGGRQRADRLRAPTCTSDPNFFFLTGTAPIGSACSGCRFHLIFFSLSTGHDRIW
jgi:hypothetical protein